MSRTPLGRVCFSSWASQCDGVSQMLEHARFLASANPHRVLIALIVKNVFGEISRAWCRGALQETCRPWSAGWPSSGLGIMCSMLSADRASGNPTWSQTVCGKDPAKQLLSTV